MTEPLGLYLHIPWCVSRCSYCDFNTYINSSESLRARYHTALLKEIRLTAAALHHPPLSTVYFGGGTPTMLHAAQLSELLATVRQAFPLSPMAEISTEANPGTLHADYLAMLRAAGFNRLSLGVQSFEAATLQFLQRAHNVETVYRTVEQMRAAGFTNFNLDLIFNLPGQGMAQWANTLQQAIALRPAHLSIYALIVEPGTPLQQQIDRGQVPPPDDDLAAAMYQQSMVILADAGYTQYEISNWAAMQHADEEALRPLRPWENPPYAAVHNLLYWRNQPYLGLGAGAFSTFKGERWANLKRPQQYIERWLAQEDVQFRAAQDDRTGERLSTETIMTEQIMLGLRLVREGLNEAVFERRFGVNLRRRYQQAISMGLERGLLAWLPTPTGARLRLTERGRFLANQAIVPFMPD